jgi:hypothetical protein
MKTPEKNNTAPASGFTLSTVRGKEKTVAKIRLDDKCGNGHAHFSVTADIYEQREKDKWVDAGGGCCHEHILKIWPELAPLVALHLSDQDGVPMHAAGNAFYWFAGMHADGLGQEYHGGSGRDGKSAEECRRIFAEHIRATPEQVDGITASNPRTAQELQAVLENMDFPAQWKREAQAAIAEIARRAGDESIVATWGAHTPSRPSWQPLTPETREAIAQRRASGYYDPEQVAARDAEKARAHVEKRRAEILKDYAGAERKAAMRRDIDLELLRVGQDGGNWIYYDHTGELTANWTTTKPIITKAEFDAVTQALSLPAGIVTRFQEKPKY